MDIRTITIIEEDNAKLNLRQYFNTIIIPHRFSPCDACPCNTKNGGTGICNCTLNLTNRATC